MKKTLTTAAVSAALLLGAATASAETLWTIGTQDGDKSEFSYGKGFGGSADNDCATPFVIGSTNDSDFPFEMRSQDASAADPRFSNSCEQVIIQFELTDYYANPTFNFYRMGGEKTDIYLGEDYIDTVGPEPVVDPNPSTLFAVELADFLAPGTYTVTLAGAAKPVGADGYHWVDYLELVGARITQYTKFSGRYGLLSDGKSKEPLYTFQGFFYVDPVYFNVEGSAEINYKALGETCTFGTDDQTIWQLDENYINTGGTIAVRVRNTNVTGCSESTGTANIVVVDRDALNDQVTGCEADGAPWSERGAVKVNVGSGSADDGAYEIFVDGTDSVPCPNSIFDPVKLDKGNAHVVDY